MRIALVLIALALPASAGAATSERVTGWTLAAKHPPTTKARSIKISVGFGVCDVDQKRPISRIVVRRQRKRIVVTVYLRAIEVPPYTVCPALARIITRTVSLKGRRGTRSILDGSTRPPTVRVK